MFELYHVLRLRGTHWRQQERRSPATDDPGPASPDRERGSPHGLATTFTTIDRETLPRMNLSA